MPMRTSFCILGRQTTAPTNTVSVNSKDQGGVSSSSLYYSTIGQFIFLGDKLVLELLKTACLDIKSCLISVTSRLLFLNFIFPTCFLDRFNYNKNV